MPDIELDLDEKILGSEETERTELDDLSEVDQPAPARSSIDLKQILLKETGPGEIGAYIQHPFNFNGSVGVAQIIRGLTGMCGDLRKAVFDIAIGTIRMIKGDKVIPTPALSNGSEETTINTGSSIVKLYE